MARPLGLPVGSVRAICLLGLSARMVLDLRAGREMVPYMAAALVVSAAAYFAARASRHGVHDQPKDPFAPPAPRQSHPLWLPAGTIRLLFLGAVVYGSWLWLHEHGGLPHEQRPLAMVLGAFVIGVLMRWFLCQVRRPDDASTLAFEHAQAFAAIAAAGGLVWLAITKQDADVSGWLPPVLASMCTYYAGVR